MNNKTIVYIILAIVGAFVIYYLIKSATTVSTNKLQQQSQLQLLQQLQMQKQQQMQKQNQNDGTLLLNTALENGTITDLVSTIGGWFSGGGSTGSTGTDTSL